MAAITGNAVVGQSGGPTNVINQSLVGVVQEARKHKHIAKLLGSRHGVSGIVKNDFVELSDAPEELLERIALTPSAALGSSRDKPDAEYCTRIFDSFKKNNVRYFFYIGGNDSADTARIVQELAQQHGHELHVVHIPKTIDNDLRVHDHTPGYGSAAKFVAQALIGVDKDNRSLPGIMIDVIMGRSAGFLTAASALGRKYDDDGPHLIYLPETPLDPDKLLADVDKVYSKLGRCIIAVSEGIVAPDGRSYAEVLAEKSGKAIDRDSHGNIQLSGTGALGDMLAHLITAKLPNKGGKKLRVRADTFGYLQRSFAGIISPTDASEARTVGRKAVEYTADPKNLEGSVVMTRKPGSKYEIDFHLETIKNVARVTKHFPQEWIVNGNDVSKDFIDYAKPLVGDLPQVGSFAELK